MPLDQDALLGLLTTLAVGLLPIFILVVVLHGAPPLYDDPKEKHVGIFSLFSRAGANANLNPVERGILKFLDTAWILAAVAMLPVLSQALNSASIDWHGTLIELLKAGAGALLVAFIKYCRAQGDPLLNEVADVAQGLDNRLTEANGLNTPVIEPDPQPPTDTPQAAALDPAA